MDCDAVFLFMPTHVVPKASPDPLPELAPNLAQRGALPHQLTDRPAAIGPYPEDRTPIHFAALLDRECGGFTRPPGYDE